MKKILNQVKNIYQEGCVTIILNTHRTTPDNKKDPILLKNLIKEAENRLFNDYDKRFAQIIFDNINKIAETIDHSKNLESLIIFANQEIAEYTSLPIDVKDRVVIDNTFATRDIIRAINENFSYYILVLSRQKARLIEAFNDKVINEKTNIFPLENTLYTKDKLKLSTNKGTDNLIEEFFNRVDKIVLKILKDRFAPFIIASEKRNYDHYIKIADEKDAILGNIERNRDDEKPHEIVSDAWDVIYEIIKKKNQNRIEELYQSVNSNKFVSDINDIWNAIQEGKGKTLFIKKNFFQPAVLIENKIQVVEEINKDNKGIIDDIVDEMIEQNLAFGGDTVFVEGSELDNFQNIALTVRY